MRLMPTDEYRSSPANVSVRVSAKAFVVINYTWQADGEPQDGSLLLSCGPDSTEVRAVWADSWHCAPHWTTFSGSVAADGVVHLAGSYPEPGSPDRAARTRAGKSGSTLETAKTKDAQSIIAMCNEAPGHPPYQVVELSARR